MFGAAKKRARLTKRLSVWLYYSSLGAVAAVRAAWDLALAFGECADLACTIGWDAGKVMAARDWEACSAVSVGCVSTVGDVSSPGTRVPPPTPR